MSHEQHSGSHADPVYVHKPSLMGAAWELILRPDALEWRAGRHEGRIPYARVTRIRLSFRAGTMQTRRFVTDIWWSGGPRISIASTTWRSMIEQAAQDRAYGAFVRELNERVAAAGAAASFETGTPAVLYWPGLAVFTAVTLALVALAVHALAVAAWVAAALVGGFLALFLWQSASYFLHNRPGHYRPQAPPKGLVPD